MVSLFKFVVLIVSFIVIYFLNSFVSFLLFFGFLVFWLVLCRVNVFKFFRLLILGGFLSFVVVVSSFVVSFDLVDSFELGLISFVRFFFYFCCSLIFKYRTSSGEIAFIVSYLFVGFSSLGYNQNKMYTLVLVVLNNIYFMYFNVGQMYMYMRLNHPNLGRFSRLKMVVSMIVPFISNALKQQDEVSLALISKEYQPFKKRIKYYRM